MTDAVGDNDPWIRTLHLPGDAVLSAEHRRRPVRAEAQHALHLLSLAPLKA
jgi:hypothetical protein